MSRCAHPLTSVEQETRLADPAVITQAPALSALLGASCGTSSNADGVEDPDTNGARYGASAIPERWLDCVPERERIERLVSELLALS